jgi:hypothetical protein
LAQSFSSKIVEYVTIRNLILPWEEIILLKYNPLIDGKNADFSLEEPTAKLPSIIVNYADAGIQADQIISDANFYKKLRKSALNNITLEVRSFEDKETIISKMYGTNNFLLWDVLIYQVQGNCSVKQFSDFMSLIKEHADKYYNGNLMSVEPIIIAAAFENKVSFFIEKYNRFETAAQRVPIMAFTQT